MVLYSNKMDSTSIILTLLNTWKIIKTCNQEGFQNKPELSVKIIAWQMQDQSHLLNTSVLRTWKIQAWSQEKTWFNKQDNDHKTKDWEIIMMQHKHTLVLSTRKVSILTVENRKWFTLGVWKRDQPLIQDNLIKEKWLLTLISREIREVKWARPMWTGSTSSLKIEVTFLNLAPALKNQFSRKASEVGWEMMSLVKLDQRDQVSFQKQLLKDKKNMKLKF